VAPTLADIRAARLLANRVQVLLPQDALEAEVVGISRRPDFDPVGMTSRHGSSRSRMDDLKIEDCDLPSSILHLRIFQRPNSRTVQQNDRETCPSHALRFALCLVLYPLT